MHYISLLKLSINEILLKKMKFRIPFQPDCDLILIACSVKLLTQNIEVCVQEYSPFFERVLILSHKCILIKVTGHMDSSVDFIFKSFGTIQSEIKITLTFLRYLRKYKLKTDGYNVLDDPNSFKRT